MKPNFFILGAPKCGTTSLAKWLSQHPEVFISEPKEPRYFNSDFSLPARPRTISQYESLFATAENFKVRGDATTGYLCSDVALDRILEYEPDASFIICLRPPFELFLSLHKQRMKEGYENIRSPVDAWFAQSDRSRGRRVPRLCPDPKQLHYERFCRLGAQVSRVLERVSATRVKIILLEDVRNNPDTVYSDICSFLDISDYTLDEYSHENPAKVPRSFNLARAMRFAGRVRNLLGVRPLGIAAMLNKLNLGSPKENSLPAGFVRELESVFEHDITLLEQTISKDLSHWKECFSQLDFSK